MKLKTLIATALLGAVISAPALAHDYVAKINGIRQTLSAQEKVVRKLACKEGKMNLCGVINSLDLADKLLAAIPADISNHELVEHLDLVSLAISPMTDEYALKGQFEGLTDAEVNEANGAIVEIIHSDGWLMKIAVEIKKSEGQR